MIPSFEQRHSQGGRLCPCIGGSSSSQANQTTQNTDMRVVGGADSTNLSVQNSDNLHIIATDHGAVKAGMQLGTQAIDAVTTANATDTAAMADMFKGALGVVSNSGDKLALAYQSGQAGDQTSLKYVGFIVVGLAAVAMFRNK